MEPKSPGATAPVLAVVVLYNVRPEEARTVRGLRAAFAQCPDLLATYRVVLWDNSPDAAHVGLLEQPFEYRHAARNEGVSGAYNEAARIAWAEGRPWMLVLDDDTEVTAEFLSAMAVHAAALLGDDHVAAIVPFLFAGPFQLSPRLVRFARHTPVPLGSGGLEGREMFAANSGCVLRVCALDEVGGYSGAFWLDYSDIDVFRRFYERGKQVFVAGDARLQHEIAMLDYESRMTPARYRNYLMAEGAYHDMYKGSIERAAYLGRLLVRAWRQRRLSNSVFSRMAARALLFRFAHRRQKRLAAWRQAGKERSSLH